jgi:ribA/ribD-fused uncharacterized protein
MSRPIPRRVSDLVALCEAGGEPCYHFFYGHTPKKSTEPDKSCLSQWFLAPFRVGGVRYETAEHYMMARKAELFGDTHALESILAAPDPKTAKAMGRLVQNFDSAVWDQHCFAIVVAANIAKFSQNRMLRDYLLATGDKVLVEASKNDKIWGIGLDIHNSEINDPHSWRGTNLLGFALMEARAAIAAATAATAATPVSEEEAGDCVVQREQKEARPVTRPITISILRGGRKGNK